jgi:hypothetical protein
MSAVRKIEAAVTKIERALQKVKPLIEAAEPGTKLRITLEVVEDSLQDARQLLDGEGD